MAQIIRSISDLRLSFQRRASLAAKMTRDEIFKVVQENIKNYYHEKVFEDKNGNPTSTPKVYQRTWQFLNSLIKTDIVVSGSTIGCSVEIDMGSLNYVQSAETVIDMINRGYHADTSLNDGAYETPYDIYAESHFWNDAIQELGGEQGILALMKQNLIKCGVPVL